MFTKVEVLIFETPSMLFSSLLFSSLRFSSLLFSSILLTVT